MTSLDPIRCAPSLGILDVGFAKAWPRSRSQPETIRFYGAKVRSRRPRARHAMPMSGISCLNPTGRPSVWAASAC